MVHLQTNISSTIAERTEIKKCWFRGNGKNDIPRKKNISEHERKPTTNSCKVWRHFLDSNPGHIGWRRVLSPLNPQCSLFFLLPRKAGYLVKSLLNSESKLKPVENLLCSQLQALLECVCVFFNCRAVRSL